MNGDIEQLNARIKKIDKLLKRHKSGGLIDPIYEDYGEDNEIGNLLKERDKIILKKYDIEKNLPTNVE